MAERAGKQPDDRVDHDHRGKLPSGQHVVADTQTLGGEARDDALVHAVVAPAQQRDDGLRGEPLGVGLAEGRALGRQRDHRGALGELQ